MDIWQGGRMRGLLIGMAQQLGAFLVDLEDEFDTVPVVLHRPEFG